MSSPQPRPAASAAEVEAAWDDTKLAQVLYHDWEAQTYDEKWSIAFAEMLRVPYLIGGRILDRIIRP